MLRRARIVLQAAGDAPRSRTFERGMYVPIKHRVTDTRVDDTDAQITSRPRRELRTEIQTGATRQTVAPAWSAAKAPTHFLSLRLPPNNVFQRNIQLFHEEVKFSSQRWLPVMVPVRKLHLTLGVLTLPSSPTNVEAPIDEDNGTLTTRPTYPAAADVCAAVEILLAKEKRKGPLTLRLEGLGTFQEGRVLFSRVACDHHSYALSETVRKLRQELGHGPLRVDMKGNPHDSYVPHITVAKIRPSQRQTYGRAIPASVWASHQHEHFGTVNFSQVDLCEMATDDATGYYRVVKSFQI